MFVFKSFILFLAIVFNSCGVRSQNSLLLVATGSIVGDFADLTEVLDLNDAGNKCQSKFDFPFGTMDSNGVLLNQSSPLFCGGYVRSNIGLEPQVEDESPQCVLFNADNEDGLLATLRTSRQMASSCMISSEPPWTNTNSMWITGGMHHVKDAPLGKSLASTEIVTFQSGDESQIVVTPGPDLPVHVWGHCILVVPSGPSERESILIGGVTSEYYSTKKTFYNLPSDSEWREGPDMSIDRYQFGCSLLKIGGAYHAAVAGGYSTTEGMMFSVELMDLSAAPEERKWVSGPNMPWELAEFPMVTSPSGNGVLTVGGVSGRDFINEIFELSCEGSINGCTWNVLHQQLQEGRKAHVAMLIPDNLAECENDKSTTHPTDVV